MKKFKSEIHLWYMNFMWKIKLFFLEKKYGKYSSATSISDPVHCWFELSYSQYLTLPRSLMEAMPIKWQRDFVKLLEEFDDEFNWRPEEGRYWVRLKDGNGRYSEDKLQNYRHPDYEFIESLRVKSK